jgi:hypothetical protein
LRTTHQFKLPIHHWGPLNAIERRAGEAAGLQIIRSTSLKICSVRRLDVHQELRPKGMEHPRCRHNIFLFVRSSQAWVLSICCQYLYYKPRTMASRVLRLDVYNEHPGLGTRAGAPPTIVKVRKSHEHDKVDEGKGSNAHRHSSLAPSRRQWGREKWQLTTQRQKMWWGRTAHSEDCEELHHD